MRARLGNGLGDGRGRQRTPGSRPLSVVLAAAAAWLAGCSLLPSWTEIDPPVPQAPPPPPLPPPPDSRIRIPVRVDLQSMVRKLDALLPDSLAAAAYEEDFGTGGPGRPSCGVECGYRVAREGPASLRAEGRTLEVSLGVRYGLTCRRRIPCFGPLFTASCGWDGEPNRVGLRFSADVEIRKDWTAGLRTRLDSLDNRGACRVRRLPLYVPDRLLAAIYNRYSQAGPRVDSLILDHLALRSRVEQAWRKFSRPIPLGEGAWIVLAPAAVSASPPRLADGVLNLDLGLTARPRVTVGREPEPEPSPLPDIADIGPHREEEGFRLHVPVRIGYGGIDSILRRTFRLDSGGFRIPPAGRPRLIVDGIKLSGYGERVLVEVHFHGAARGKAFLIGMPRLDPETLVLSIADLDLELHTRNPLLTAAKWLKQEEFTEAVGRRIIVDLRQRIEAMASRLDAVLEKRFAWARLDVKLDGAAVKAIRFSDADSAMTVYVEAAGRLEARIGD